MLIDQLKRIVRDTPFEHASRTLWDFARRNRQAPADIATFRIIDALPADARYIDVGCNIGQILRRMIKSSPNGRFWAFEPVPRLAAGLERRFGRDPRVVLRNSAATEAAGEATFFVYEGAEGWSGLAERQIPDEATIRPVTVATERIDDVVGDERIDLIKIDVEGAELGALKGASALIARWHPLVIFEHGLNGADHFGTTPEQVFDFFAGHHMAVSALAGFLDGEPRLTRQQFASQFHEHANCDFIGHPDGIGWKDLARA